MTQQYQSQTDKYVRRGNRALAGIALGIALMLGNVIHGSVYSKPNPETTPPAVLSEKHLKRNPVGYAGLGLMVAGMGTLAVAEEKLRRLRRQEGSEEEEEN